MYPINIDIYEVDSECSWRAYAVDPLSVLFLTTLEPCKSGMIEIQDMPLELKAEKPSQIL